MQVTQISKISCYLHNVLLFISNDRLRSTLSKIPIRMAIFFNLKSSRFMHPRFHSSTRANFHDVILRRQEQHTQAKSLRMASYKNIRFVLSPVATQIGNTNQIQRLTVEICLSYSRTCSSQCEQLLKERWLMPKIVKVMMIVSEILIGTDSMLEFLG